MGNDRLKVVKTSLFICYANFVLSNIRQLQLLKTLSVTCTVPMSTTADQDASSALMCFLYITDGEVPREYNSVLTGGASSIS